jgi:hypothetical protein
MSTPSVSKSQAIAFLAVAVPLWIGVGAVATFAKGALAVVCWYLFFVLCLSLAKFWRGITVDRDDP